MDEIFNDPDLTKVYRIAGVYTINAGKCFTRAVNTCENIPLKDKD